MDKPGSHRDISALYNERRKDRDLEIAQYDLVEAAIRGDIPSEFDALFAKTDVKLRLRTIRAADDGLTKFLSEVPVLPYVDVMGTRNSQKQNDAAEKVEKIAHGWHNGSAMRGGVEFDGITLQLARHQVRFGDGCLLVHPDYERKLVFLEVKDPRCHYPPRGWHPFSQTPLDGTLLVYTTTLGEVKRRFAYDSYGQTKADVMSALNNAYKGHWGEADDAQKIKVGVYRSREYWCVSALADHDVCLAESQTGDPEHPGVCGVVSFKQFDTDPLFLGQIGIEAALVKVLNQQIQNTERINRAPIVGPPLLGDELRWGEYNVVDLALMQQGRLFNPQRLAPDSPNNLTQVMGSLLQLSQMFNYNPESMMGGGEANSGKAIQQLQAGPRALVTNILWSPYKPAFPRAYDDCLEMELNLWPNERKLVTGRKGKKTFEVEYTPSVALEGYKGRIKIEEARTGGYSAFLEAVQKKDAGLISTRDVMEADPDIRDVESTLRRIDIEQTDRFVTAAFEALGNSDPLTAIRAAAEVNKRVGEGQSKAEAIQGVIADGLLEPPAPEIPPGVPGMEGGMPPELAALMGGGAEVPPPSLAAARGF